jgi:hypothetical protein
MHGRGIFFLSYEMLGTLVTARPFIPLFFIFLSAEISYQESMGQKS